jgi:Rnl2 family RNA ligase
MSEFAKYPHLESVYKVPELQWFTRVIATEKVHGTNARIQLGDGILRVGGRNEELSERNTNFGFYNWVMDSADVWRQRFMRVFPDREDIIIYGEWFGPGIQKGVQYGVEKQFRAFDVRIGGSLLDYADFISVCDQLDIPRMPLVYDGPFDLEALLDLRHKVSVVGQAAGVTDPENTWEGIVLRPPIMLRNKRGEWVMAKLKDEAFEERKSLKKSPMAPVDHTEAIAFAEEWVTPMRLEHVLQQAREQQVPIDSMQGMGSILRLMAADVLRESGTPKDQWKLYGSHVAKQTKELFQTYLQESLDRVMTS